MSKVKTEQLEQIARILTELGYSAEVAEGDRIRVRSGGIAASIMVYADQSLSLSCWVDGGEEIEFDLDEINQANIDHRFSRFSVEENRLRLASDFVFEIDAPDAKTDLKKIMTIWDAALGTLKELVRRSLQPA